MKIRNYSWVRQNFAEFLSNLETERVAIITRDSGRSSKERRQFMVIRVSNAATAEELIDDAYEVLEHYEASSKPM